MLNNPDTAPSASINHWIVSILAFHFELRHIPGKSHGPDGLSCQPPQPGDLSEEDSPDDFDDWVDNLYGFLHFLNPSKPVTHSAKLICNFAIEIATQSPTNITESSSAAELATYTAPHSNTAILTDKRLEMAHDWLISIEQPDSILDHKYSLVIRYATGFFINGGILWKRNPQGAHK